MIRKRSCLFGSLVLTIALTAVVGCSEPASSEAATNVSQRTDAPPADFSRARCSKCSCGFFSGHDGQCRRPSCKHHWSDHQ